MEEQIMQMDQSQTLMAVLLGSIPVIIISLIILVVMIAALWKIFTKAGKPGWACLVPFYNMYLLVEMAGLPILWFILMFIPFANIVAAIYVPIKLAERFGKGTGFGIGLFLLGWIFYPILGFGSAQYQPAPKTA